MGGLPCAKQIIDGAARMMSLLLCVLGAVAMRAALGNQPTEKQVEEMSNIESMLGSLVGRILNTIEGGD
jgi:hypothetical protein